NVVGRWFKQQNWNRILTTVRREIFLSAGGLGVVELRPRLASAAKPHSGDSCECQNAPEGWSSLSTIEKASLEGLFWLVTEKCEFGVRRGDGAFSLAQTFTPGEMEQMIYLNLLQEVSLGFALAGYPIEDEEKLKMKKKLMNGLKECSCLYF